MTEEEPLITEDTPDAGKGDWLTTNRGRKVWHMRLNRALTDEELAAGAPEMDATYDEDEGNYSMVKTLWLIEKVAPDIEVLGWWHAPYEIYVEGLYIPAKVYVMENAMSLNDAIEGARKTWKEQFGHHGVKATIWKARLATKKDMRKMQEIKSGE